MANSKQKPKFSDNKLFWMSALSLLLSITTLIFLTFYIQQKTQIDRLVGETNMKTQMEAFQLKLCYENDIKPCSIEAIQEFNKKTYGE